MSQLALTNPSDNSPTNTADLNTISIAGDLVLRCNNLHDSPNLSDLLQRKSIITTVDLEDNGLTGELDMEAIINLLKTNLSLTSLKLAQNAIVDSDLRKIEVKLMINTSLTSLSLCYNKLNSVSAARLTRILHINKTLQRLDLRHNRLTTLGGKLLLEGFCMIKPTLTHLDLRENDIDVEAFEIMRQEYCNRGYSSRFDSIEILV